MSIVYLHAEIFNTQPLISFPLINTRGIMRNGLSWLPCNQIDLLAKPIITLRAHAPDITQCLSTTKKPKRFILHRANNKFTQHSPVQLLRYAGISFPSLLASYNELIRMPCVSYPVWKEMSEWADERSRVIWSHLSVWAYVHSCHIKKMLCFPSGCENGIAHG